MIPNYTYGLNGESIKKIIEIISNFTDSDERLPKWKLSYQYVYNIKKAEDMIFIINVSGLYYYMNQTGYRIDRVSGNNILSAVCVSQDFKYIKIYTSPIEEKYDFNNITYPLNQAFRYRAIWCNCFMMHASSVIFRNEGILFCGVSGAGKSTQAGLWEKYKYAKVMNYDQNCIIIQRDEISIHGSPWAGKENIFLNCSVPLKAILFIKKSSQNLVTRVSFGEAFSLIYLYNYLYPINELIESKYQQLIIDLVSRIPVYRLECDTSAGAVAEVIKRLWNT